MLKFKSSAPIDVHTISWSKEFFSTILTTTKDTNLKMKESKCYDEITLCLQVNKKIGEMKVDVLEHESLNKIMEIPPQILSDIKRQIEEISEFLFQQEEIRKG